MNNPFPEPSLPKPCPECGGKRIFVDFYVAANYSAKGYIKTSSRSKSLKGFLFKPVDEIEVPISHALLCTKCGLVSLYITNPEYFADDSEELEEQTLPPNPTPSQRLTHRLQRRSRRKETE